jgi:hypothetical protein
MDRKTAIEIVSNLDAGAEEILRAAEYLLDLASAMERFPIGSTVHSCGGYDGTVVALDDRNLAIMVEWHKWKTESFTFWEFPPYKFVLSARGRLK